MNAVVTQEPMQVMDSTDRLIQAAFAANAPIDQMERLFDLKMRADAARARNAYVAAMAQFKRMPPRIVKDKKVAFTGTSYSHATLGNIAEVVIPALAEHGFSHRWINDQSDTIGVTCIITHEMGHSEENTLKVRADDSGKKNAIQAVASAVTYCQRYTLLGVLGLATHDQGDDDGRQGGFQESSGEVFYLEDWKPRIEGAKGEEDLKGIYWDAVNAMKAAKNTSQLQALKDLCAARKKQFSDLKSGNPPEREPGQEG